MSLGSGHRLINKLLKTSCFRFSCCGKGLHLCLELCNLLFFFDSLSLSLSNLFFNHCLFLIFSCNFSRNFSSFSLLHESLILSCGIFSLFHGCLCGESGSLLFLSRLQSSSCSLFGLESCSTFGSCLLFCLESGGFLIIGIQICSLTLDLFFCCDLHGKLLSSLKIGDLSICGSLLGGCSLFSCNDLTLKSSLLSFERCN